MSRGMGTTGELLNAITNEGWGDTAGAKSQEMEMSRTALDTNLFVPVTDVCPFHGFVVGIVPQPQSWRGVGIPAARGKTASQRCEKSLLLLKRAFVLFC